MSARIAISDHMAEIIIITAMPRFDELLLKNFHLIIDSRTRDTTIYLFRQHFSIHDQALVYL